MFGSTLIRRRPNHLWAHNIQTPFKFATPSRHAHAQCLVKSRPSSALPLSSRRRPPIPPQCHLRHLRHLRHQHSPSTPPKVIPRHQQGGGSGGSRSNGGGTSNTLPPYLKYGLLLPLSGLTLTSIYAYYSCLDDVPFTNRRRLLATNPAWEADMGHRQYKELLVKYNRDILPEDHRACVTVRRVGGRIALAAEKFNKEYNHSPLPPNSTHTSPYTYTVIRSSEANAFVLPGNHVFVLTGLFRYTRTEDELASVLGHEMAHNLARHAGERISEGIFLATLSRLALLLDPTGLLFSVMIPAQALLYTLPHSREHEVEADEIGLVLASEACYDPRAAMRVFGRMKEGEEGGNGNGGGTNGGMRTPPEFISTHPGYDTRLKKFEEWMPSAMERFNEQDGGKCRVVREEMKRARKMAALMADERERRL